MGEWPLLAQLDSFLGCCGEAVARTERASTTAELVHVYAAEAARIEGRHIQLRGGAMSQGLPAVSKVADRAYAGYTDPLNEKFFRLYAAQGSCELAGFELVTSHLQRELWSRSERRVVIIVDALRLDAASAIQDALKGHEVEIHTVRDDSNDHANGQSRHLGCMGKPLRQRGSLPSVPDRVALARGLLLAGLRQPEELAPGQRALRPVGFMAVLHPPKTCFGLRSQFSAGFGCPKIHRILGALAAGGTTTLEGGVGRGHFWRGQCGSRRQCPMAVSGGGEGQARATGFNQKETMSPDSALLFRRNHCLRTRWRSRSRQE